MEQPNSTQQIESIEQYVEAKIVFGAGVEKRIGLSECKVNDLCMNKMLKIEDLSRPLRFDSDMLLCELLTTERQRGSTFELRSFY